MPSYNFLICDDSFYLCLGYNNCRIQKLSSNSSYLQDIKLTNLERWKKCGIEWYGLSLPYW